MYEKIGEFSVTNELAIFDPVIGLKNVEEGLSGILKNPKIGRWTAFTEKRNVWIGKLAVYAQYVPITDFKWVECDFGVVVDSGLVAIYNHRYVKKLGHNFEIKDTIVLPFGVIVQAGIGDGYYPGVFEMRDSDNRLVGVQIDFFFDYEDYMEI